MAHPPIFFDPQFVSNVIIGYVVTVVGALILLVGGAWWSWQSDNSQQDPPSGAWRALCRAGWAIFIGGWIWQILGYINTHAVTW